MLKLAFRKICGNKARTTLTVLGIALSTVMLLLAMYYLHVSDALLEENFNLAVAEQRLRLNEVFVSGVDYYDVDDTMVADVNPIRENTIQSFLAEQSVDSICVEYCIEDLFLVDFGTVEGLVLDRLNGVDPRFASFSDSLIDTIREKDQNFNIMVAGRTFVAQDIYSVLLSETTVKYLGCSPDNVVGSVIMLHLGDGTTVSVTVVGVYSHSLSTYYRQPLDEMPTIIETSGMKDYAIDMLFTKDVIARVHALRSSQELYPSGVCVTLKNVNDIEGFLAKTYNTYYLNCISDYLLFRDSIEQQTQSKNVLFVLGAVILMVSMLVMFNTMLINMSEQKRFIAVLHLLGFSKTRVRLVLILQSLSYGLIGLIIGVSISCFTCVTIGSSMFMSYGAYVTDNSIFMLPISNILVVMGLTLLFCVLVGTVATIFTKFTDQNGLLSTNSDLV